MTGFLIAAGLILAATLALLSRPWWQRASSSAASRRELNTAIYRDQMAELERDRASGQLAEADFQEAQAEIRRRLLEDAVPDDASQSTNRPKRMLIGMLAAVPLLATGLYFWLGNPAAMDVLARRDFSQQDVEQMVAGLAAKLESEPENYQGWAMLARSYKAMRRVADAERAYEKAWPLVEKDAQLLADYADLLASKAGDLTGRPEELVNKALQVDPENLQALWLAGTAAFNRSDFPHAVEYWQRAQQLLPPDSEDARMLANIIEEAKQKAGKPAAPSASTANVRGRLELAATLKSRVSPDDTVFIVVREAGGPPMPMAVKRVRAAELPLDFTLGDGDSLTPDRPLSSAKALIIEARVSKSGAAQKAAGDLISAPVSAKVGSKGLRLSIDKAVE